MTSTGRKDSMIGRLLALSVATALALPAPAPAQTEPAQATTPQTPATQAPITQREPTAVDVIATPATDLNLRKGEIPPLLLAAQGDPYGLAGLRRCADLAGAVGQLDAVLGDDLDVAQTDDHRPGAGTVAQSLVGSFIPFRGLIREISGANEQQRRLQEAIYAGTARRAFLKGVGLQRGCAWPARPATPEMLADLARRNAAKAETNAPDK